MEKEVKTVDPMLLAEELSVKIADQYRKEVESGQKTVEEFLTEKKSEFEEIIQDSLGGEDEKTIYQFFGKFVINILVEFELI